MESVRSRTGYLSRFRTASWVVLGAFFISGIVRAWFNPSGAHGQRQIDTLGLSVAFYHDLTHGIWKAFSGELLYPKVLQRALSSGTNASEFPFLNVLSAPFFFLGLHLGAWATTSLILGFNVLAAFRYAGRLLRRFGVDLPGWIPPLLYFSVNSIDFVSSIPLPEGLAFPLMLIGLTWLLEAEQCRWSSKALVGVVLMSLSVLVKPTAVVALGPIFVWYLREWLKARAISRDQSTPTPSIWPYWLRLAGQLALILVVPAWWYTIHAKEILAHVDGPQVFALARFAPLKNLSDVQAAGVLKLFVRQILKMQFPFYAGALWFVAAVILPRARIWAFMLLAGLFVAISLDGPHIWAHFYYFFGADLIALCLMGEVVAEVLKRDSLWVSSILLATAIWGVIYGTRVNVWQTARTPDAWTAAQEIRSHLAPDAHLVTDDEVDATKLVFLGRPGTIAGHGIGQICNQPAYQHLKLDLVIDKGNLAKWAHPGDCFSKARLVYQSSDPRTPWWLFEVSR